MRIVVLRGTDRESVEISADLSEVVVRGHRYPVNVVGTAGERVELEIGGERVVVEGWPVAAPTPPGPLEVNGERWNLQIERIEARSKPIGVGIPLAPAPPSKNVTPVTEAPTRAGSGTPVVPPMPGKIVELRVQEGDHVTAGQALLVLEAMKMRNEIVAPTTGTVRQLRVAMGASARAREPMLWVVPD